ncbi:DUF523 domain-containing protein [Sporomusa termitida]|uniref:Uncharacterized protein n=1 Tax=Sporomusa termitida TaxID=2377 RepID=A0A517DUF3_9FIRM|nr:DUF523 domain-containing protein [Sporomusa termitida]QDR80977.1 hypothetical protein SPTER_23200 [Sporomusa termitida]
MLIVSACLAGVQCRYNGQDFLIPEVAELVKTGQALPLCPEILAGLATPRPCVEQCGGRFLTIKGEDLTSEYRDGAKTALKIARLVGCKTAILKSKSPTCGCGVIYDGTFSGTLTAGDGILCTLLKQEKIKVCTENKFRLSNIAGDKLLSEQPPDIQR